MDGKGKGGWVRKVEGGVDFGYLKPPPELQVAPPLVSGVHRVVGGGTESALRGGVVMAGVRRHYYP